MADTIEGGSSFVDWNKYSLDQLAEHLEQKFRFNSSGTAKAVLEMVNYYKKHSEMINKDIASEDNTKINN